MPAPSAPRGHDESRWWARGTVVRRRQRRHVRTWMGSRDHAARRERAARADGAHRAPPRAGDLPGRRSARLARERHDPRRWQAAAPAAGRARRRGGGRAAAIPPTARSASCARPSRSSSCTRRRSCTTTDRRRPAATRAPTVAAAAGRKLAIATGDLLFSRAFAELARNGDGVQLQALSHASSALAEGELLQREDAYAVHVAGRALPAPLRTEDGGAVRGRLPPGCARGRRRLAGARRRARRVRPAHRSGLSDAGRRARRVRPRRAHGQVARNGPARRHRDPAVHPRARARAGARRSSTWPSLERTRAGGALCERIAATGALDEAREQALAVVAQAKSALPPILPNGRAALLDLVADAVVERYR